MRYYTLGISVDLDVIGTYPQIEKESGYNLADPHSYWNVTWDKIPDFNPVYKIKLKSKAKSTSLLNSLSGFCGLTVNEELKSFWRDLICLNIILSDTSISSKQKIKLLLVSFC